MRFVQEVLKERGKQLGETLLQKIFFLTTFTLINEESNEVKADLEKTLKQLLLLELRDGRPVSYVSTATKWSEGDHPAHLALSSRLAALMAEQGFVAATVGVVKHLLLKLGDDDNGAVLLPAKCNTLDALSQLVKVCEGKNKDDRKAIALVDDRQDELANLLLHPQEHLRAKVMELITVSLDRLDLLPK